MNLTALLACKDRDLNLSYCLASINKCTPRPQVVLVDFGSKTDLKKYEAVYDWIKVTRVIKNTKLFHKARALNIGLKQIKTRFVCATDVDQIFNTNFFGTVFNHVSKQKNIVMCRSWFLRTHPKSLFSVEESSNNYGKLLTLARTETNKVHGEGCCMGLPLAWFMRVHGWDENYKGYGGEDSDIILRAKLDGFKKVFINKKTNIIHMPHPKTGIYYSKIKHFEPNKNRYKQKTLNDIIANTNNAWGIE